MGAGHLGLDRAPILFRQVADLHQSVDEETEAQLGWKPARRSVGREDEPELFQVRHHVADGGRRQRYRQQARQISRTDGLAGRQITLDDLTENLARTLVERRETNLCRSNRNVVRRQGSTPRTPTIDHWGGLVQAGRMVKVCGRMDGSNADAAKPPTSR